MKSACYRQARASRAALAAAAVWLGLWSHAAAQSTPTATVQISVTPMVTRSVTVALQSASTAPATAPYGLGALNMATLTEGATPYIVTNTGNIWETFALQISSESDSATPAFPWHSTDNIAANLAVADAYELFAEFGSTASAPNIVPPVSNLGALLVEKAGLISAGPSPIGEFASATTSGMNVHAVPGSNSVGLWFAIQTSNYTTTASQKNVVVTVVAQ